MNTMQMIERLVKNPSKIFEVINRDSKTAYIYDTFAGFHNVIVIKGREGTSVFTINDVTIKYEWKEVKQPVSWEEAREWMESMYIQNKAIFKGDSYSMDSDGYLFKEREQSYKLSMAFNTKFLDGDWYIKEE